MLVGRLELTPPKAARHRPAHQAIGRILRDPGQTGRSPHGATLLEQDDASFEVQGEAPRAAGPPMAHVP